MISVVICNYNCGRFLGEAVRSVLSQSEAPGEIIVVDDGSTDDSAAQVRPFLGRVRWLPVAHGGQASALNVALGECRGDWVAFLESDDVWHADKLKECLAAFNSAPELAAVQHPMQQATAELRPLPTQFPVSSHRAGLRDFLDGTAPLTGLSALIVKRTALYPILPLPTDLTTCVDEYLQPRILAEGPIQNLAQPLGFRRIHGRNFYAALWEDTGRLARYRQLRLVLDHHLESFLRAQGLQLSEDTRRRKKAESLELDFFFERGNGHCLKALRIGVELVSLHGTKPYAVFKTLSLAIAFLSLSLYRRFRRLYENQDWLPRLRKRLFP